MWSRLTGFRINMGKGWGVTCAISLILNAGVRPFIVTLYLAISGPDAPGCGFARPTKLLL